MTKREFKDLDIAYQRTTYLATTPDGILRIRPNQRNILVDSLLRAFEKKTYAFITAYNPHSTVQSDEKNAASHLDLCKRLMSKGYVFFEGEGCADGWPSEKSVFILGIDKKQAIKLGSAFNQNAILFGKRAERPTVLWLPVRSFTADAGS